MPGLVELRKRVVPRLHDVLAACFGLPCRVRQKVNAAGVVVFLHSGEPAFPLAFCCGARGLRLKLCHYAVSRGLIVDRRGLLLRKLLCTRDVLRRAALQKRQFLILRFQQRVGFLSGEGIIPFACGVNARCSAGKRVRMLEIDLQRFQLAQP